MTKSTRPANHVDDPGEVGRRLKQARESAGLSQRQLAFKGCSAGYISRIEAGERTPSVYILRELGRRLGVTESFLATGQEADQEAANALMEAEVALRFDDLEKAEALYALAAERAVDDTELADALAGLGEIAFHRGEPELARNHLEQAVRLYQGGEAERPAVMETLGQAYVALGEDEAAIEIFESGLTRAQERQDLGQRVRFSVQLANTLIDVGSFGRADEILGAILAETRELGDPVVRARLYWSQARLHALKHDSEAAARYGRKTLELLALAEDTEYAARAHQMVAHIELDRGRPEEALRLLDDARDLLGDAGSPPLRARFDLERARALAQLGRTEEAAATAMEAAGTLAEANPIEAGRGYHLVAEAFEELGEDERARELYELAVELLERRPNRYLVAVYARLAHRLEQEGNEREALQMLKRAVEITTHPDRSAPR